MKRFIIFIFLFSSFFNLWAFDKEVRKLPNGFEITMTFHLGDFTISKFNNLNKYDFIFNEDESKVGFPKLPSRVVFVALPPETKIKVELLNKRTQIFENALVELNRRPVLKDSIIEYETVNEHSYYSEIDYYPEKEIEVVDYTWIRDFYCAVVQINTHRYSFKEKTLSILEGCDLKVTYENEPKSFIKNIEPEAIFDDILKDVIINFNEAKEFRSKNPGLLSQDTTANWIDYSKEYVKLAIPEDNIYRITYNDLLSYGINPSLINPMTFKIFRLGKEIPIYVKGESDLQFDPDDYIEFWAEKNYSYQDYRRIVNWGEDYINYMNRYSDTSIVWLSWGGNNGRRVIFDEAPITQTPDTITSHQVKLHFERDVRLWYYDATVPRVQLPYWQENKVFTWLLIGSSGSHSISFQARDFIPQTPVKVITRLISNAAGGVTNAHRHGMSLNRTTPSDTITYNFRQTVNFIREYPSSQLLTGTNTIRIFGLTSQVAFHQSLVDWVDVEYFRRNVAIGDTLKLNIPDTVSYAMRIIRIENITVPDSELVIYKTSGNYKKFVNFISTVSIPKIIYIIDSVKGGDTYYITKVSKISKPIFVQKKHFVNLRNPSRGADYIILASRILANSSEQYKNFINNSYNLRTELVFVDDVFDEFSFGQVEAEAIKRFLKYAYSSWTAPKPSFLILIGDANYDYRDVITPAPTIRKRNLVTSYGHPVSDVWYVMWDPINVYFPQMYVGRIPANNDNQVLFYLQKHQTYLSRRFDEFNKTFLFFSGGDGNNPYQLEQIRLTNQQLAQNYVNKEPIFGKFTHFYKTASPPTNFGPYTLDEVQRAIDEGGLYISYIGHSGTRTWDNSITEVEHIKNKYPDRFPLISDFGCSTGKFAEPDIDAFGELFVCQSIDGQALIYIGNSSWGYISTSLRFPRYFYEQLTFDTLKGIGRAHLMAKIRQLNETGLGDANRVFTYCNLLFGDPLVGLKLPTKPNLYIDNTKIKLLTSNPNDQLDSLQFLIQISNYGLFKNDTITIKISDYYRDTLVYEKTFIYPLPKLIDTILISIPVNGLVGNHKLYVKLDALNVLDEIYEDDNSAEFHYIINSTSIAVLENDKFYNTAKDYLNFLNPFMKKENLPERLLVQVSENHNFTSPREIINSFDTLLTRIYLHNIIPNKRYYYRVRLDDPQADFSETYSFHQSNYNSQIFINEESPYNSFIYNNAKYDTLEKNWQLDKQNVVLRIQSAGAYEGSFGSIMYNSYEQLPNTYYWGLVTALIDTVSLKPHTFRYFNVPDPGVLDSLANYINRLPQGTWIAITISADAQQNILAGPGSRSRNAIKTLGSLYIDSVQYRESWCILGKKGAPIGSVPEAYKKYFTGVAVIELSKQVTYDSGSVVFPPIKNVKKWNYVKLNTELPPNSSITNIPIGIRNTGEVDTLFNLSTSSDSIMLASLDTEQYPSVRIMSKLAANQFKESPKINSLNAYFEELPELAVNYQVVSLDKDTIMQGERVNYEAKIYNVGKSTADSFKVTLELIKPDNNSYVLLDTLIENLSPNSFTQIKFQYINKIYDGYGQFGFKLSLDNGDKVREFYETNNIFLKNFYVKKDTTTSVSATAVVLLINGKEINDWEYVEPKSNIEIKIDYPVWFPIFDTSAIRIELNGRRIYSENLNFDYDTIDRKINILYQTILEKGEHNLRVYLKDAYGRFSNVPVIDRYFKVTSDLELLRVYNYPNPFSNGTYFTFILTHIPDEIQIKIYTVAGRLIKNIKLHSHELSTNFNKIYWDGRDEDGDLVGNGVYLYKVIAKKGERIQTTIQKLAVVR